jgi:hypothetical protein
MSYRAKARRSAIQRGMRFLRTLARQDGCLAYLGTGLLYFCRSLATTAADPTLRAQGVELGRLGFSSWRAHTAALSEKPDSSEVTEHVRAYGAVESLGVRSPTMKSRLRRAARAVRAAEYLGFDPRVETPPGDLPDTCTCGFSNRRGRRVCVACRSPLARMTRYRAWCFAFISAYCAERYGITFGARYRDAMRWLPVMRPYPLRPRAAPQDFYDASYAITHVVYTMNDYGRYLLSPYWFPWEYAFLYTHLESAMAMHDPDMTGEFLDTLRAFGVGDEDAQIRRGLDFLLDAQNPDGSWAAWDGRALYTDFHATWAAIDGLREFAWTGPGLLFPELLPSLQRWARVQY